VNSVMTDSAGRADMKNLLAGLKKRKSADQLKAFSAANFDSILKVFPIWLCNLSDLHRVLPLKKEMFDVVIIDEASQCDIASVLPAMQRAKRVVIAGDQKQLRHVAFISRSNMSKFACSLNLSEITLENHDYRNVSLMDLAIQNTNESGQVALLNEHFRSLKPIINFSNSTFYQNELRLMRDRPWETISDEPLEFKFCNGNRGEDGVNHAEISAVLADLEELVKQSGTNSLPYCTVGILSPFRAQVDALTYAINDYAQRTGCGHCLAKFQLKIGTAHSFQGEERGVMLISIALGKADNVGSRNFLEQEDVFNVSITRAQHKQIVYHSVLPQDLPASSLLAKYITSSRSNVLNDRREFGKVESDQFAEEFSNACKLRGITTSVNESVASIPVDVLLEKNGNYLGVDLVGYPGYSQAAVEINRQQILQRVGIRLVPVGYVEWQIHQVAILDGVEKLLN
jgi:superfamily I DNA and/or RNA helicase